ncbi:MAG: spherulation-specific family 4 protein, partial [Nitrososphaerales archaeon]
MTQLLSYVIVTVLFLSFNLLENPIFASRAIGIMIPLYTYPGTTWDTVIATKNAHPTVPIVAIINPNNGPGNSKDTNYVTEIQQLQSSGIIVMGYVQTNYAMQNTTTIQSDIDSYKSWYPQITGIFFDEMSNSAGDENYYQNLSNYAKSVGFTFTVGNPGTET